MPIAVRAVVGKGFFFEFKVIHGKDLRFTRSKYWHLEH